MSIRTSVESHWQKREYFKRNLKTGEISRHLTDEKVSKFDFFFLLNSWNKQEAVTQNYNYYYYV